VAVGGGVEIRHSFPDGVLHGRMTERFYCSHANELRVDTFLEVPARGPGINLTLACIASSKLLAAAFFFSTPDTIFSSASCLRCSSCLCKTSCNSFTTCNQKYSRYTAFHGTFLVCCCCDFRLAFIPTRGFGGFYSEFCMDAQPNRARKQQIFAKPVKAGLSQSQIVPLMYRQQGIPTTATRPRKLKPPFNTETAIVL